MDFGLLLLIVFILAPLLEKLLTSGRQQPPPDQQVPGPGQRRPGMPAPGEPQRRIPTAERDEEELPFRSVPAGHREEEEAAAMLPDDLWEVLTGEKRPSQRPVPTEAEAPPPVAAPRKPDAAQLREIERLERKRREEEERLAELRRGDQRRADRQQERDRSHSREAVAPRQRRLPKVDVRDRDLSERQRSSGPPPGAADRHVRPVKVRTARAVESYDTDIPGPEERRPRSRHRVEIEETRVATGPQIPVLGDREELRRAIIMNEVLGRPKGLDGLD